MTIWPFRREVRSSYTSLRLQEGLDRAKAGAPSEALATVEAAAGLWERGFMAADSETLNAEQLGMIGRNLLLKGESVWSVERGALARQAHTYSLRGSDVLSYHLYIPMPSETVTKRLAASDVAHFRIGMDPARPWEGISPLKSSKATRKLLEKIEQKLDEEHSGSVGNLIGVPDIEKTEEKDDEGNVIGSLARDLANLKGKTALIETGGTTQQWGGTASHKDTSPIRIGPMPSQYTVQARTDTERTILAACGVPVALVNPDAGTDTRESWRRFLHGTLQPVARMIVAELARVGIGGSLTFNRLMASDLAGRSRSYKQLREAGMDDAEARQICGF